MFAGIVLPVISDSGLRQRRHPRRPTWCCCTARFIPRTRAAASLRRWRYAATASSPPEPIKRWARSSGRIPARSILAVGWCLPGIIDAHTHPAESAQDFGKCSLDDKAITPPEIKVKVAACLKEQPAERDEWFEVDHGQSVRAHAHLGGPGLHAARPAACCSAARTDIPCGRTRAALKLAKITAATKDPAGGHIERDAAGRPTGTLRDNAAEIADAAKPKASLEHEAAQLGKAFDAMRAVGITSVQDAAVDDHTMQIYKRLYDAHRLNMRVRGSFHLKDLHESAAVADRPGRPSFGRSGRSIPTFCAPMPSRSLPTASSSTRRRRRPCSSPTSTPKAARPRIAALPTLRRTI